LLPLLLLLPGCREAPASRLDQLPSFVGQVELRGDGAGLPAVFELTFDRASGNLQLVRRDPPTIALLRGGDGLLRAFADGAPAPVEPPDAALFGLAESLVHPPASAGFAPLPDGAYELRLPDRRVEVRATPRQREGVHR
jgi:hypothetical protein